MLGAEGTEHVGKNRPGGRPIRGGTGRMGREHACDGAAFWGIPRLTHKETGRMRSPKDVIIRRDEGRFIYSYTRYDI